eukprot:5979947-Pyramimonas_sp.AAC.1
MAEQWTQLPVFGGVCGGGGHGAAATEERIVGDNLFRRMVQTPTTYWQQAHDGSLRALVHLNSSMMPTTTDTIVATVQGGDQPRLH